MSDRKRDSWQTKRHLDMRVLRELRAEQEKARRNEEKVGK